MTESFFTDEWTHLDMKRPGHRNPDVERPEKLQEMLELAKKLSKDIPFVRTDFYTVHGKVYFGELTFYPASGLSSFFPKEYDEILGDWLAVDIAGR